MLAKNESTYSSILSTSKNLRIVDMAIESMQSGYLTAVQNLILSTSRIEQRNIQR